MKGGIYADECCLICGGKFQDVGNALSCPSHPKSRATRFKVVFGNITRRFRSYNAADVFLNGLRHETNQGKFDSRDYRKDKPLGFSNLTETWLKKKEEKKNEGELKQKSYSAIHNHLKRACAFFGNISTKDIDFPDLDAYLSTLNGLSSKTKANHFSTLHDFLNWFKKMKYVKDYQLPEFPQISVTMKYRNLIGKDEQSAILDELYRITGKKNLKVWLAIKMLATYPSIRPGELLGIKEKDINLDYQWVRIVHPKGGNPKIVPLIEEDIEIIKSFMNPKVDSRLLPFFRHENPTTWVEKDAPFGHTILYNWWKKAAGNIGIHDVDMYGGTKHSTVTALNQAYSAEDVKKGTQISTNKAFDRYLHVEHENMRKLYREARPGKISEKVVKIDSGLTRKSPNHRQSRRYEIMNRSKRIERMNHLKVVIPETYSIDQCADLPFPGSLYTHGLSLHHDQPWKHNTLWPRNVGL